MDAYHLSASVLIIIFFRKNRTYVRKTGGYSMAIDKQPLTAKELIEILQKVPPDTDLYVNGYISWEHGFVNVDFPITSVQKLKTYADSNQNYIELFGKSKTED